MGHGGCTGGNWRKIGTPSSLQEAKDLMLADEQCSQDQSMLFYSPYSSSPSWSARCATAEHHSDCTENNQNWQEYILHVTSTLHKTILIHQIDFQKRQDFDLSKS